MSAERRARQLVPDFPGQESGREQQYLESRGAPHVHIGGGAVLGVHQEVQEGIALGQKEEIRPLLRLAAISRTTPARSTLLGAEGLRDCRTIYGRSAP